VKNRVHIRFEHNAVLLKTTWNAWYVCRLDSWRDG